MQLDWFTIAAQAINFIILLLLLRRFLFKPVVRVMSDRQQQIKERFEEAEKKKQDAEKERKKHHEQQQKISKEREDILASARDEAEKNKQQAIKDARDEVDKMRRQWMETLRQDKSDLAGTIQKEMGQQVYESARHMMRDLADDDLQSRILKIFLKKLSSLDDKQREKLTNEYKSSDDSVSVVSALELSDKDRKEIEKALHALLSAKPDVEFRTDEDLVCGIEVAIGSYSVAWSFEDYTARLEEEFGRLLEDAMTADKSEHRDQQEDAGNQENTDDH